MLLLSSLALADIPPTPPPDQAFAQNTVSVAGLEAHPDFVLLLYPGGSELRNHQVFSPERSEQQLSDGLLAAGFWLMPKADHAAWSLETSAEIMRQEVACAERGEGCAHISRFSPRYAPPTGAISCGVILDAPHTVPEGEPTKLRHELTLTAASATACALTAAQPEEAPKAVPSGGCATARGGASGAVLLSMLILGWRRRCGS